MLNRLEMIAQEINAGGDVTSILQGIATWSVLALANMLGGAHGHRDSTDHVSLLRRLRIRGDQKDFDKWPVEGSPSLLAVRTGWPTTLVPRHPQPSSAGRCVMPSPR